MTVQAETVATYPMNDIRSQFPILAQSIHGKPLAYLDNAATTQKPQRVIDAVTRFYQHENANVHRGIHTLSERATEAFEAVRRQVAQFIGAAHNEEIAFVKGTTEGINLVAQSYLAPRLKPDDEIIVTQMEHHANLVPWQQVAQNQGAHIKAIPLLEDGSLDMTAAQQMFSRRTRMLALSHVSNVLGTINPVKQLIQWARQWDVPVLIDGAQAPHHLQLNMQELDCDFYVFSGHKIYGPTGVGVLYGRYSLLEAMPPYQGGGNMIVKVGLEQSTYKAPPERFEAGTMPIASVIGLGQAIAFLQEVGVDTIATYEQQLHQYAQDKLKQVPGLRLFGDADDKAAICSFVLDEVHPHDLATVLDTEGVAVRAGHHCAMPLMERFNQPAMLRASMACYNHQQDIDQLVEALHKTLRLFRG